MSNKISIDELIKRLDIFTINDKNKLIEILKRNYFVIPNHSNLRLQRQCEAFLIPSFINFYKYEDSDEYLVCKAVGDLKKSFEKIRSIIKNDNNKEFLMILDTFNINEGSLFPELENQMKYIRWKIEQKDLKDIKLFEVKEIILENLNRNNKVIYDRINKSQINNENTISNILPNNIYSSIVNKVLIKYFNNDKTINYRTKKSIATILKNNIDNPDWIDRQKIKSNLIIEIAKIVKGDIGCSLEVSKEIAINILEEVIKICGEKEM